MCLDEKVLVAAYLQPRVWTRTGPSRRWAAISDGLQFVLRWLVPGHEQPPVTVRRLQLFLPDSQEVSIKSQSCILLINCVFIDSAAVGEIRDYIPRPWLRDAVMTHRDCAAIWSLCWSGRLPCSRLEEGKLNPVAALKETAAAGSFLVNVILLKIRLWHWISRLLF